MGFFKITKKRIYLTVVRMYHEHVMSEIVTCFKAQKTHFLEIVPSLGSTYKFVETFVKDKIKREQGRCPPPCPRSNKEGALHRVRLCVRRGGTVPFGSGGAWDGVGPTPHAWVPLLKTPPPAQLLGPPPAWFMAFASPFNKCMQWHVQLCRQNARKAATHAGSTSTTCAGQFAPCNVTPAKCTTRAWAWKGGRFIPSRLRCDQRP
jgi:hypothetical protein